MSIVDKKFIEKKFPLIYIICWFVFFTFVQRCLKFRFVRRINLRGIRLNFWSYACSTGRGIGRTSSEDLSFLLSRQEIQANNIDNSLTINYFPSIIFCPYFLPKNSIVVIQDVIPIIFPQFYSKVKHFLWRYYYPRIARKATRIITISELSKNDVNKYLNIPSSKISVVPCHVKKFNSIGKSDTIKFRSPFILFIGTADAHKNIKIIFDALQDKELSHLNFVLAGNQKNILNIVPVELSSRVHCLGKVSDSVLASALRQASALVYPSLYEGFGLPPFEAAFSKCPIICSDIPSLREIWSEEEVLFAGPYEVKEWIRAIKLTLSELSSNKLRCKRASAKAEKYCGEFPHGRLLEEIYFTKNCIQVR